MKKFVNIICVLCFIIFAGSSILSCKSDGRMSEEQAVKLAEQFIADNGYTKAPPKREKIKFELFDSFEKEIDSLLLKRANTICPHAFSVCEEKDRWYVGFLHAGLMQSEIDSLEKKGDFIGYSVIVLKDSSEIRMAHKPTVISKFKRL